MEGKYVQMTINDWLALKGQLEAELRGAAAGFVRIGFLLRKIEETKGYENDGSKSLAEWAKDNYGLSATAVSRFMKINERYSIDGYSNQLRAEYANYGSAKLSEMLALTDSDLEMVSPDMKRDDIREIRKFSKEMAQKQEDERFDGVDEHISSETDISKLETDNEQQRINEPKDPCHAWIVDFFWRNGEILDELFGSSFDIESDVEKMKEIVNPSGSRVFRSGMIMVSMLDNRIMVKDGFKAPAPMSWRGFFEIVKGIYENAEAGSHTYKNIYGQDPGGNNEKTDPGQIKATAKTGHKEARKGPNVPEQPTVSPMPQPQEEIAPAQKSPSPIVGNNAKTDSTIAKEQDEEVEQVEIDEILPRPTEPDRLRDLKDQFGEVLQTLRIMLDVENFESMQLSIDRLDVLRKRLIAEKQKKGEL